MSESYSESNAVPEQTLSAMAESRIDLFDTDDQVGRSDRRHFARSSGDRRSSREGHSKDSSSAAV